MAEETDGRHARTGRTRTAVLDAFVALAADGTQPTMEEVADEAAISVRSVFRHFPDVPAVVVAALAHALAAEHPGRSGIGPSRAVAQRVVSVVEARSEFNESIVTLFGLAAAVGVADPGVAASLTRSRAAGRRWLSDVFTRELGRRSGSARTALLDAMEAAVSPATWHGIRVDQGLNVARGRRVVETLLVGALAGGR